MLSGAWKDQVQSARSKVQSQAAGRWAFDIGPGTSFSEPELNEITPLLCRLGAGALAWYKIRNTPLANTRAGEQLHEVYRRQRLSALLHERELVEVLTLFRAEGIEAVLVKGWAIASRYPDPALRSYGDLDLCVAPAQFAKAQAVLKRIQTLDGPFVDLHSGFGKIGVGKQLRSKTADDWDELYARSQVVTLEAQRKAQSPKTKNQSGFPVRILGDEDHLRILCLHLLRSGARRPAWFCDVAMLVAEVSSFKFQVSSSAAGLKPETSNLKFETRFNWEVCLGRNPVHAKWVGVAIRLAHELLDADITQTPFSDLQLPRWLVPAVLKQWGERSELLSPKTKVQSLYALRTRWDNPIRAVAAVGGQFDERSRLRYRVAELIARTPEVPDHLRKLWFQQRSVASG